MSHPTGSVVAALVSTTLVVTVALGWAGWRLLDQERALDEQRARVEAERAGDAVAGGIRGKLAEAGERRSFAALDDVVDYYDRGGNRNPFIDAELRALRLTPHEKRELVSFLGALSGDVSR